MLGSLLTFFVVGLVVLAVASILLAVVGVVFSLAWGIAAFLLFKVAPILLVGYLIMRFLAPRHKRLTAADRKWLSD